MRTQPDSLGEPSIPAPDNMRNAGISRSMQSNARRRAQRHHLACRAEVEINATQVAQRKWPSVARDGPETKTIQTLSTYSDAGQPCCQECQRLLL